MDGFQFCIAEGDDVSIVQISAQGHGGFLQLEAEHAALFRRFVNPELIGLVGFGLQTELFSMKDCRRYGPDADGYSADVSHSAHS